MRRIVFSVSLLCLIALQNMAQVTVDLVLEQDQFLPAEPIPIAVRITNRSGRVLELGEFENWLTFSIESKQVTGGVVQRLGEVPVVGAFSLPSSKRAIKRVDIAPYFALLTPGKYLLTATVAIPGWEDPIASAPATFYIIEGSRLWEREVGLPSKGTNGLPEMRRYLLQQGSHLRSQPKLYLRVTDEAGLKVFKLQTIGTILSFSRPEPQVDADSNLHVLYQNGPMTFCYTMFTPDGELIKRQTWDYYGDSRPRLKTDKNDQIVVTGGRRRETREDIPPSVRDEDTLPPLSQTLPTATNSVANPKSK